MVRESQEGRWPGWGREVYREWMRGWGEGSLAVEGRGDRLLYILCADALVYCQHVWHC